MKCIKILIADDHHVVAQGLKSLLQCHRELEIVGLASNGKIVLQQLNQIAVDVILMDISMPVLDGLDATKLVTEKYPSVKVLILSTHDDGRLAFSAIEKGAKGYLLKNASSNELIHAIHTIYNGDLVFGKYMTTQMINFVQKGSSSLDLNHPKVTRREKEIIQLIAEELTTKEIAKKLFLSANTVVTHKRNLFVKFDVKNSVGLIKTAIERGLL